MYSIYCVVKILK